VPSITANATDLDSFIDTTCAIVSGGVRCWGDNTFGQLGNGASVTMPPPPSNVPVAVMNLSSGATRVSVGHSHACAIVANGAVRCWGKGDVGQLGNGLRNQSSVPVAVMGLTGATVISAGLDHTCAVVNGAARCWGGNAYGELGNNSNMASDVPVTPMGLTTGVTAIAAGDNHTCAIVSGGARCWGKNGDGQLGNMMGGTLVESTTPQQVVGLTANVTSISVGYGFSCAVHSGVAKCWGDNFNGELGNMMGPGFESNVPVNVSNLTMPASVASGSSHTCARRTNGGLRCWGTGSAGELGDGMASDSNVPVTVSLFP
jgi:alpha-tubulin suppressor-like RCC1 family protein